LARGAARVSGWFSRRFSPGELPGTQGRDLALEGLRGICACLVIYGHMTIPQARLDPGYAPSPRFWWFNLGITAVLFFFVLSGYVIGLSISSPFSAPEAGRYLRRRLTRLVPVNTAAVLLSWLFIPRVARVTLLGNLAFLQNFKPYPFWRYIAVMPDNLNLWSLNFEALYYVAFIAVWWLAPRRGPLFGVMAAAACVATFLPGDHVMSSAYLVGGLYWLTGLGAAWLAARDGRPGNWPSALLAMVVMWPLAPLQRLLYWAHVPDAVAPLPIPSFHRLDQLPVALWLLLAVTGRGAALQSWLAPSCLVVASAGLAASWCSPDGPGSGALTVYSVAIVLAWVLLARRPEPAGLARLAPLGAISFGIYAVGFPLQFAIFNAGWLPSGSVWTYAVRVALLGALAIGLGWVLERKLQPAVRRALGGAAGRAHG
jgi:peptidoglycan/LPS O-acetylase OafA/YrhL